MALTSSTPINLLAIQSEFSAGSLSAASTAAGLNPLPTSMLDFLGLSSVSITLTIDDVFTNQGDYIYGVTDGTRIIPYTPDQGGSLWPYQISTIASRVWGPSSSRSAPEGTTLTFNTSLSYLGNYNVRYRGVTYTFTRIEPANAFLRPEWFYPKIGVPDIFNGYGVGTVTISKS